MKSRTVFIIILFIFLAVLFLTDYQRTEPTIYFLPQFIYVEHILAGWLLPLFVFSTGMIVGSWKKALKEEIIFYSSYLFSIGLYGGVSFLYDYGQWDQVIANFIGIGIFAIYAVKMNRTIYERGWN